MATEPYVAPGVRRLISEINQKVHALVVHDESTAQAIRAEFPFLTIVVRPDLVPRGSADFGPRDAVLLHCGEDPVAFGRGY